MSISTHIHKADVVPCTKSLPIIKRGVVTDGVVHFTHKRGAIIYLIDMKQLTELNCKCDSGLKIFYVKVKLIIYITEYRLSQTR